MNYIEGRFIVTREKRSDVNQDEAHNFKYWSKYKEAVEKNR